MQNGIKCKLITYGCNTSTGLYYMKTSKEPLKKKKLLYWLEKLTWAFLSGELKSFNDIKNEKK